MIQAPDLLGSVVRAKGLEPPQVALPEPKSGASTNFATPALLGPFFPKTDRALRHSKRGTPRQSVNSSKVALFCGIGPFRRRFAGMFH